MKSTLSIILCFTSIITCFSQKILSEHIITFSDENTSNYMIGLQEQKSGIKIASYSSLPYKGQDSKGKTWLFNTMKVNEADVQDTAVKLVQKYYSLYPAVVMTKARHVTSKDVPTSYVEIVNDSLPHFQEMFQAFNPIPAVHQLNTGGSGFKVANSTVYPSFTQRSLIINMNNLLDFSQSEVRPNRTEFEQTFKGYLSKNTPITLVTDSLYQVALNKYDSEEKWGMYMKYNLVTYTRSGKIINNEPIQFSFLRNLIFQDIVYDTHHKPVGVVNIFGKFTSLGGGKFRDTLTNRLNLIYTDMQGKILKRFDFQKEGGYLNPYFVKYVDGYFEILALNEDDAKNIFLEKVVVTEGKTTEIVSIKTASELLKNSVAVNDFRTNAQLGADNIFSRGASSSILKSIEYDDKTGDTYLFYQAIQDKFIDIQSNNKIHEYGTVFILKINRDFTDAKEFIVLKNRTATPTKIHTLFSKSNIKSFLLSDYGQTIVSFSNDGLNFLEINPIYAVMQNKYPSFKNFVYNNERGSYFFVYNDLTSVQSTFPDARSFLSSLPSFDSATRFPYDVRYSNKAKIVEVQLP